LNTLIETNLITPLHKKIYTMSGIAGIVSNIEEPVSLEQLKRMTDAIAYRGFDGEGHLDQ
jgi:hypothetical protein